MSTPSLCFEWNTGPVKPGTISSSSQSPRGAALRPNLHAWGGTHGSVIRIFLPPALAQQLAGPRGSASCPGPQRSEPTSTPPPVPLQAAGTVLAPLRSTSLEANFQPGPRELCSAQGCAQLRAASQDPLQARVPQGHTPDVAFAS